MKSINSGQSGAGDGGFFGGVTQEGVGSLRHVRSLSIRYFQAAAIVRQVGNHPHFKVWCTCLDTPACKQLPSPQQHLVRFLATASTPFRTHRGRTRARTQLPLAPALITFWGSRDGTCCSRYGLSTEAKTGWPRATNNPALNACRNIITVVPNGIVARVSRDIIPMYCTIHSLGIAPISYSIQSAQSSIELLRPYNTLV
ncbi:uncharacterized protein BDR25DRAFT_363901 [Lindgomyces ingoldianus]|uniref:Uncharacterized protein n=1 Tax=Lindgomyces ingoldianus TaxID=673940 RepID=A0ACB6Q6Y6_9PLEO|nr:uncharacterized protein BDR25DRAFT_363901 [Lindgomyces ingoldianus]KAF2462570.1 hypothetical protein BDR25DRAFT_363901 [Lindgomyces ingoldianus]